MAVTRGKVFETIRRHSQRTGVTLVELLVAIALTLMVILAVVRVFDLLGGNVTQSRSILEMAARTRTVADQLQMDLSQLTLKPIPPVDPASAPGYFEIIEGIRSERDPDGDGTFLPNLTQLVFRNDPVPNTFVVYPTFETFATVSNESVSFPPSPPTGPSAIINPTFLQEIYGVLGDTDDIWMGTIRSSGEPFRGRITDPTTGNVIQVESPLAEIAWWIEPIPGPQGSPPGAYGLALIRRVFLILPNLNVNGFLPGRQIDSPAEVQQFLAFNDVSVRFNGGRVIANSLADLTERRNRFAHWATPGFDLVNRLYLVRAMDRIVLPDGSISSRLNGSDLISSDLVAFDLRVYDPLAPIFLSPRQTGVVTPYALTPVDAGFYNLVGNITSNPPLGYGAYVDLGYLFSSAPANTPVVSHFSARPHPRSGILLNPLAPRVYCTWSARYERDGIDQDGDGLIDEGTNGLDDPPGSLAVDDTDEQETSPPYPAPLRGMEIILRTRDASTQQVRQSSIVADFVTH